MGLPYEDPCIGFCCLDKIPYININVKTHLSRLVKTAVDTLAVFFYVVFCFVLSSFIRYIFVFWSFAFTVWMSQVG